MGRRLVLILSFVDDAHLELVTPHLDRMNARWELLATDQLGGRCHVSLRLDPNGRVATTLTAHSGWTGSGDEVGAVWNRRRMVDSVTDAAIGQDDPLVVQYIREQKTHVLDNLLSLQNARWVNDPAALRAARPKFRQLVSAQRHGLSVPRTLCSDDPTAVREFAATADADLITKVVSPGTPLVPNREAQYMVFTQPFDPAAVSDSSISAAPALYQERVMKESDARVIVVGSRLFGCLIASQSSERTALDWRRYEHPHVRHTAVEVPVDVAAGLERLHSEFGLVYSASDFAITPDGEWVFLEMNPNGQWGWLEEEAGLPIGEALAEELAHAADP